MNSYSAFLDEIQPARYSCWGAFVDFTKKSAEFITPIALGAIAGGVIAGGAIGLVGWGIVSIPVAVPIFGGVVLGAVSACAFATIIKKAVQNHYKCLEKYWIEGVISTPNDKAIEKLAKGVDTSKQQVVEEVCKKLFDSVRVVKLLKKVTKNNWVRNLDIRKLAESVKNSKGWNDPSFKQVRATTLDYLGNDEDAILCYYLIKDSTNNAWIRDEENANVTLAGLVEHHLSKIKNESGYFQVIKQPSHGRTFCRVHF